MSRLKRVEITLGLSWLFAAACGATPMGPEEMIQQFDGTKGTTTTSPSKPAAAGSMASPGIARASARIEPLVVAAAATAGTSTAAAGAPAGAAGMGASTAAGSGAAGTSGSAGASAAGASGQTGTSAGGSGGTGTGAGIAAGSGAAGSSTASAGTGAGGTSAAGSSAQTMTAAAGTAATPPSTGAAGMASPGPSKAGAGAVEAPANIMGSANFASNANGVSMTVMVSGCQSGKEYPIHLHQGSSCESAMTQGGHWDMTRGEGIPNIKCGGRQGATMVVRANTDATTAWSVGDASASDVVGHTVVIHDADDPTVRIACGVITRN